MGSDALHFLLHRGDADHGALSPSDVDFAGDPAPRERVEEESRVLKSNRVSVNHIGQGWGVVYADSERGRQQFAAIADLWNHRANQLKRENLTPVEFKVRVPNDPAAARVEALRFVDAYNKLSRRRCPLYVLILGDFSDVPVAFDWMLGEHAAVGRLCLPSDDDYKAYANKLVASETATRTESTRRSPRLMLFSANHDAATKAGHAMLIRPMEAHVRDVADDLEVNANDMRVFGPGSDAARESWESAVEHAASDEPTVLVSMSHGWGRAEWSADKQRASQGQMLVAGTNGRGEAVKRPIDLTPIESGTFLPQGIWFYYACFGGGTPKRSEFAPWLRRLVQDGIHATPYPIVETQAKGSPFVARMPQLALANPKGPLAVFAHVDVAFTHTFAEEAGQQGNDARTPSARAMFNLAEGLLQGDRAGVARYTSFSDPMLTASRELREARQRAVTSSDALLTKLLDPARRRPPLTGTLLKGPAIARVLKAIEVAREHPGSVTLDWIAKRANVHPARLQLAASGSSGRAALHQQLRHRYHNWMAFHDLQAWIVLGDPAARLPLFHNLERGRGAGRRRFI